MSEVIGTLRRLLTGAPPAAAPGLGARTQPWRLDLAEGWASPSGAMGARSSWVWAHARRQMSSMTSPCPAQPRSSTPGRPDGRSDKFASTVSGEVSVAPRSVDSLVVDLTVARLRFLGLGVQAGWRAGSGLRLAMTGGGVELEHVDPRSSVPESVPSPFQGSPRTGRSSSRRNWAALESVLASLLGQARVLLSMSCSTCSVRGAADRLGLGALIADPSTAVLTWARISPSTASICDRSSVRSLSRALRRSPQRSARIRTTR